MTRTATIITAVIVLVIAGVGLWLFMQPATAPQNQTGATSGKISSNTDAQIRNTVIGFGAHLKNVSLLSTSTLSAQLESEYGPYLSQDLLSRWQANPSAALGREVSSPWPDRIEVNTVSPNGDGTYTVSADIVEVTSADTATSSSDRVPVTLTVAQSGGNYVITDAQQGAPSSTQAR
jgi:hypothetical protein